MLDFTFWYTTPGLFPLYMNAWLCMILHVYATKNPVPSLYHTLPVIYRNTYSM